MPFFVAASLQDLHSLLVSSFEFGRLGYSSADFREVKVALATNL